ncbi:hypothetical protein [Clostridium tunisiense]|uniref:hypothetical protein n=1 Tax=Clostridium tunisiense TaxID=219748 RepID=UPI00178C5169|nr:hypothetical protein [Clostridium tunisiense]
MSYIYSDRKTVKQISRKLNMHLIRTTLYLDYLVREGMVSCIEEESSFGVERYFFIEKESEDVKVQTRVRGENALIQIANEMGEKTKDIIVSLSKEDKKSISYTISMLSDEDVEEIMMAKKKMDDLMNSLESKSNEAKTKSSRYILMSTFAPYKFESDKEEEVSCENNTN